MIARWFYLLILAIILIVIIYISPILYGTTCHELLQPSLYGDRFPEEHFPPKRNIEKYNNYVRLGQSIQKKSSVAFVGLGYNLGREGTHKLLRRIYHLRRDWKKSCFIIYALDSTDSTCDILRKASEKDPSIILLPPTVNVKGLHSLERMARLRNSYLFYLKSLSSPPEYTMVMDMDLAGPISRNGISSSVGYISSGDYDVITANGLVSTLLPMPAPGVGLTYYDSFATILPEECERNKLTDIFECVVPAKKRPYGLPANFWLQKERGDDPVPVLSGFSGAALYRTKQLIKYEYKSWHCEHVTVHLQMINDGLRIAINPSLILMSGIQGGTHDNDIDERGNVDHDRAKKIRYKYKSKLSSGFLNK